MNLEVTTDGVVAPYEQIRNQIAAYAASGDLPPGTRLPSIRQLAGDLGLAPGTVARAYRELESTGVVTTRVGRGTTVVARAFDARESSQERALQQAATQYAAAITSLGATREQAVAALDARLSASLAAAEHVVDLRGR